MFHQTQLIKSATIELPDTIQPAGVLQVPPFDVRSVWPALRSQKRLIAATTLLSLLAAILFAVVAKPQYAATTQILIDPSDLRVVANGITPSSQTSEVAVLQVESQVRVLTSDNVLRRVIASEDLESDPEFLKAQTSPLRTILSAVLAPFGLAHAVARVDPTLAALYELQRRIRVKRAERTYVVDVTVTTDDGERSVRIANALAQAYLAEQTAARAEASRRASESLLARLNELKERVRQAEERVERFKAGNNLLATSGQLVTEQQLRDLNYQLSLARIRTAEAKSRFEQVQRLQRSGADIGAFGEAVQSQTMTALRSQYAEVMRREAEQTAALGPRHPAAIEVHAQATRLRQIISEEINRIAEAAKSDYDRARASEESLAHGLEALKTKAIAANESGVGLRELERDVQASRTVYEAFLVRSQETGEEGRLDAKNVRIISKAELPLRRSWPPSYILLAAAALVFGVSAGSGLAVLRGVGGNRDPSSRSARATSPDHPTLAVLPDMGSGDPLRALEDPKSSAAPELHRLHDALRADRKRWAGQSILLVSPHDGGEAAAVATNLCLLAAANHNVLLIDTEVRGRGPATIVSDQSRAGLIDVACGQKLLSEAVTRDPRTNINVLPLCAGRISSYSKIKDDEIKSAFDQTKRFDLVIVAGTIEDDNPAGRFFADLVDQIVLILKEGTRRRDIDRIIASLGTNSRKVHGTVLTDAKAPIAVPSKS